ncbi:hypothetical protein NC653_031791 [Populus alba x Populus x berolinensis]|uniref:Response regulatory domain-containing protein n=1 Tax=Populus alba x Populus x berolinensis TaxID=444605 RepID=A0AAD6Q232_9ROSI|nr:hypothetical protein NC653_031791 [Populus alba x Populus x berolinensis]
MTLILLNAQHQFYELWLNQDLKANLIITDYCMRGMTGCMEEGAQEFLPKPLQLSDVTKLSAI